MTSLQTKVIVVGLTIGFLKLTLSLLHYGDISLLNDCVTVILGFCCLFVAVSITQQLQIIVTDSQETLQDAQGLRQFGNQNQEFDFEALAERMKGNDGVEITSRRFRLNVYPDCFVGSEAVDWLVQTQNYSRSEAVRLGQKLLEMGLIQHVSDDIPFRDDYFFYQFRADILDTQNNVPPDFKEKLDKIDIGVLVKKMREPNGVEIKDRRFRLQVYADCFVGSEAVDWLTENQDLSRRESVAMGQLLIDRRIIHHVVDEQSFEDEYFFYRFYADE